MQVSSTHFGQDIWNFFWKNAHQEVLPCERFSSCLLSIAMQKMKCEWPQARFFAFSRLLVSCSRLHEWPLQHCPCLLSIGSSANVCLRALRVPMASSIRQCPCLGAIVSGILKFDSVLADPRTSATSSSTTDRLGERPSARCPDRTTPIARNHVFTSCTDSTTLSWAQLRSIGELHPISCQHLRRQANVEFQQSDR